MKINPIILCGIMLTACNCVSKIENIAAGTDTSTSDFSNSTSTDTDTGIFTSTEYSNSTGISSESGSFSTTTFISDLNFVESSSSSSSDFTTGEVIEKCNNSETGECKVFVTSMSTFPNNVSWETNDPQRFGDIGYVGGVNETWYTGEQISCNSTAHVICVQKVKE